jgi:hypothetical protein
MSGNQTFHVDFQHTTHKSTREGARLRKGVGSREASLPSFQFRMDMDGTHNFESADQVVARKCLINILQRTLPCDVHTLPVHTTANTMSVGGGVGWRGVRRQSFPCCQLCPLKNVKIMFYFSLFTFFLSFARCLFQMRVKKFRRRPQRGKFCLHQKFRSLLSCLSSCAHTRSLPNGFYFHSIFIVFI